MANGDYHHKSGSHPLDTEDFVLPEGSVIEIGMLNEATVDGGKIYDQVFSATHDTLMDWINANGIDPRRVFDPNRPGSAARLELPNRLDRISLPDYIHNGAPAPVAEKRPTQLSWTDAADAMAFNAGIYGYGHVAEAAVQEGPKLAEVNGVTVYGPAPSRSGDFGRINKYPADNRVRVATKYGEIIWVGYDATLEADGALKLAAHLAAKLALN